MEALFAGACRGAVAGEGDCGWFGTRAARGGSVARPDGRGFLAGGSGAAFIGGRVLCGGRGCRTRRRLRRAAAAACAGGAWWWVCGGFGGSGRPGAVACRSMLRKCSARAAISGAREKENPKRLAIASQICCRMPQSRSAAVGDAGGVGIGR